MSGNIIALAMELKQAKKNHRRNSLSSSLNFNASPYLQRYLSGSKKLSFSRTVTIQDAAENILDASARVMIPPAIRTQLQEIQRTGHGTVSGNTFTPSLAILQSISQVLYYSVDHNRTAPTAFAILSYLRPGSRHHSDGTAVDLAIIDGNAVDIRNPESSLRAIVAAINNLAPGNYALGLPRPPRTDAAGAATDAARYRHLHLYDTSSPPQLLPQYQSLPTDHYFLDPRYNEVYVPGGINGGLNAINNATAKAALRTAIDRARTNGANVQYLMADALDHLHIQQI
jgi:hypothetical protein